MYLTHFFYFTGKNSLLIIGIIFSVFYGSDEQLQVSECLVAVWSVINQELPSS